MLRGSERVRLIAMLGTLCILGMIVFRSMDSAPRNPPVENREIEQDRNEAQPKADNADIKTPDDRKSVEKETVTPGPTDEDPEEWAAAENAFQALTDGTVGIEPTDMFAYQRIFSWVEHQSFDELKRRASRNVTFDDLMRFPNKYRGTLVQVDLNVRQAIPFEDRSLSEETLYEIRGFNQDSGAWLYFVIAPSWPSGLPTGSNIQTQVRLEGYFFKLQGYLEAGAKPRAAPLKAPLLIGRVKQLASSNKKTASANNRWLYYAAGGFILLSLIFTVAQFFGRQNAKRRQAQLQELKIERGREWLNEGRPTDEGSIPSGGKRENDDEGFDFRR